MRLCNDTITVFNAKLDKTTGNDVYTPTVISGVSWYCNTITTVENGGLRAANQITVRIPEDADFSGKVYVAPKDYVSPVNITDHEGNRICTDGNSIVWRGECDVFTLKPGDIIVHGAVEELDLRPADIQRRFDEMMTILAVTDNRRAPHGKHWKVVGK